jgi:hypothetical protein
MGNQTRISADSQVVCEFKWQKYYEEVLTNSDMMEKWITCEIKIYILPKCKKLRHLVVTECI